MRTASAHPLASLARRIGVLAACALASANLVAKELDCPFFAEPKAKLQWVAQYMVFNGVPMSVKRFDSEQKPEAILAFYRQAWQAGAVPPQEYTTGPWQAIATLRGKCFFTVQVQADGAGSTGLLSATEAPGKARLIPDDKKLPMMAGSTIMNDIDHHDDGKAARTVLLRNGFSAETNASFYREQLEGLGWKMVSSYQMTTKKGPGITLVLKRGLAEASLVITRQGTNTTVLANLVDKP